MTLDNRGVSGPGEGFLQPTDSGMEGGRAPQFGLPIKANRESSSDSGRVPNPGSVPLLVKVLYTAFMCVLVPKYLIAYGPTNFLYFCDIALFLTLLAVWKEWALPISASAVGILVPQLVWQIDFLGGLLGHHVTGMTEYMFDTQLTLFTRFLSFFHFWLPLLLLYLMSRLGYDRRAGPYWIVMSWVVLGICYWVMPAPPRPPGDPGLPVNINYVFGPGGNEAQTWTSPNRYFGMLVFVLTFLVYLPTHLFLKRVFPAPAEGTGGA